MEFSLALPMEFIIALRKVCVIKSLIEDKMTSREAAGVLNLSESHIKHLKAGVKKDGEVFVIHKNRGRNLNILSLAQVYYEGSLKVANSQKGNKKADLRCSHRNLF